MIRFEQVVKTFGTKTVLNNISCEIKKGEVFCILGPSGTGKSVSLKLMIGLLTPTSGNVWVGDECVNLADKDMLPKIRNRFGYLFQSAALLAWMNVYDNVALPLRETTKLSENEIYERVKDALEKVGLSKDMNAMPSSLSGGMQKRAGLARAIVMQPEIVLYDEPTSGLDPVTSRKIDALIADLNKRLGITSVVVTHDLQSALTIADRIVMLHSGKIVLVATPQEFITSDIPEVVSFLEAQSVNGDLVLKK